MEYLNDIIFNEASIYLGIIAIVMSVISLLTIIEQWILFNKLGEKGWKSLIPIYNNWVYLKLGDLPGWLILLPIANAIGLIVASFNIPKKLNKSTALGILYLISPNIYGRTNNVNPVIVIMIGMCLAEMQLTIQMLIPILFIIKCPLCLILNSSFNATL